MQNQILNLIVLMLRSFFLQINVYLLKPGLHNSVNYFICSKRKASGHQPKLPANLQQTLIQYRGLHYSLEEQTHRDRQRAVHLHAHTVYRCLDQLQRLAAFPSSADASDSIRHVIVCLLKPPSRLFSHVHGDTGD